MNELYQVLEISKQNVHQRLNRYLTMKEEKAQLKLLIRQIREDHPKMGAKELYNQIRPRVMGRDRFVNFYNENGFKVQPVKSFQRTTNSLGVTRFPNLIKGIELTGINQVWVSDITYFRIGERFYYLTFIMDRYSREIIGYSLSKSLYTEDTTIPALKMALKYLALVPGAKPIMHSDGGGQYYCKEFLALTKGKVLNSMAESVYENPHAERVNGTIKNDYLIPYKPADYEDLKKKLAKAVKMYNEQKGHTALNRATPSSFRKSAIYSTGRGYVEKSVDFTTYPHP